ncbi:MAG: L,D-transpeptidase family protein [Anaerolineae bacterium]|nr:L,D-transpeptidase family protein [Anaerolineae bacterium]MBT3712755.1 L,D-transpeptidase family protein [Anaerolineae bacterium]MBT4310179.1 L,D-transpeptidase family protein [Anaerolineae bacterium]MBT4459881.1 L,D-transpeptidase family protein [Anaerolineae bacterium]MBT4843267.1 L,D-transpeptidase family protein [Anaerolineae bacterium]
MTTISRRDFLKLSALAFGSMAFSPPKDNFGVFDDRMLVRVATEAISVHSQPNDKSRIVGQWYRDNLLTVYEEVTAKTPTSNPIWYRVWGGFVHRARLQRVQVLYNPTQTFFEEGTRYLAEVTVPYTRAMRHSKFYGWEPLYRLYYESVHWVDGMAEGPDGTLWYRIFDELASVPYHVPPSHLRMIPPEEITPISPEVDFLDKYVDVDLTTQKLTAYEYEKVVFETTISSGLNQGNPNGIGLKTPTGTFHIREKMPSKHMGNGSLASDINAYELPGVPWTSFFTEAGHAFHGTYWHENYTIPMSHGCINMRTNEAKWLFRWLRPIHDGPQLYRRGYGTTINIFNS